MVRRMIDQVFIAGNIGKAIYTEGGRAFIVGIEDHGGSLECRVGDLNLFFDYCTEFELIPGSGIDLHSIKKTLQEKTLAQRALSLTISGFDRDLSTATRSLSIEAVEELLQAENIHSFVRNRLLARPLTEESDINIAISLAESLNTSKVKNIYDEIIKSQESIQMLLDVWKNVAPDFFNSAEEMAEGEKVLIENGVFTDIVFVINVSDSQGLEKIVLRYGTDMALKIKLPTVARLLNSIKAEIKKKIFFQYNTAVYYEHDEGECEKEFLATVDPISKLIRDFVENEASFSEKKYKKRYKQLNAHEAKNKVDRQIEEINRLIHLGNINNARKYLYDLILFNLNNGKKEHVGMTLCNLAKSALDANQGELAEELVDYAFKLEVEDAVIWTTKSEVLKIKGLLKEALDTYEKTIIRFPADEIILCGRAEVLKELGRLDNALAAYDETIKEFPSSVVARNGRAEVLKELGRLDNALAAYDEIIKEFPSSVVARNGRAEVLKELGRLDNALAAYDEIIKEFPSDVVARSGRAEVLKELGRLDNALAAYDETIKEFPSDVVARNGRISVLLLLDKFDGVQTDLHEETLISKHDWIRYHIMAMYYLKNDQFDEAIRCLEYGYVNVPWRKSRNYFATALGFARIRKKEYNKALDVLNCSLSVLNLYQQLRCLVLLCHAQAGLNNLPEASMTIAKLRNISVPYIVKLRNYLAMRYNLDKDVNINLTDEQTADLDKQIEEEEFHLALREPL